MKEWGVASDNRASTRILFLIGGGFCFGALTAMVNTLSFANPFFIALSKVLGVGWSWAAIGILAGAILASRPMLAAIATLVPAVLGYYLVDLWS